MSHPLPALTIVIVTLGGIAELAVPLPGLLSQTIAKRIELIIVAADGTVSSADLASLNGFHSVRCVSLAQIGNRASDAAAGVAVASAPFVGLHENHTRAEPYTYERLLAAFQPMDAALAPVFYPANGEMSWGVAMASIAHAEAAPPNDDGAKSALVLHHAVYRTNLVKPFGKTLRNEPKVQSELLAAGHALRYVPQTVVWHLNEARPNRVLSDSFALGRAFGYSRSRTIGLPERAGRALLVPAIVGLTLLRAFGAARRMAIDPFALLRATPPVALAATAFAMGEVRGYFDRQSAWTALRELHEFHVRGRLAGRAPAALWLSEAIAAMPDGAP